MLTFHNFLSFFEFFKQFSPLTSLSRFGARAAEDTAKTGRVSLLATP